MSDVMKFEVNGNIAIITIHSPPVNALGVDVRRAISTGFEAAWADNAVEAIVLICDGRTFFAGADITEFGKPPQAPSLPELLTHIETSPIPSIAAIHGTALGGGLETALHCHYRIATPSAKAGLPEVKLGLLPGAGGTQRLPRVIGVPAALEFITSGRHASAKEALSLGIFDALAEEGKLREGAIAFAQDVVAKNAPLVRIRDRQDLVEEHRGDKKVFDDFRKKNARKFRGFEAPEAIINCVEAAANLPYDEGAAEERRLFMELHDGAQSKAQRYVFFAERQTSKVPDVAKDTPVRDIKSVGVIGAGTMGGGIAMNFLNAGIAVTLIEQSQDALDRGLSVIRKNYDNSAKKGRMTGEQVDQCMGLISPSTDYADLNSQDLIIEAVFETMPIKKDVFGKIDKIAKPGAILASNTSYLDLDEIAAATTRPQDVIGLHFFSPANIMPLLEIVRGQRTGTDLIATALKLARAIGKTPVVSRVCYGFIANRVMTVRGKQADAMILQGVSPEKIDRVIYDYGFAMGPFQMRDLVGLDVIGRGGNEKTVASELVARDRLGQKKNGGYYDYDEKRNATLSPIAMEIIADVSSDAGMKQTPDADEDEIIARLLYPVVNEGARILDEGVAIRASDIDIACIKGYNWPVYQGGPMFWADTIGLDAIVSKLDALAAEYGDAFTPSPFLVKLAKDGKRLSDVST